MANLNPIQLLGLLKSGNPKAVVEQIITQNFANDPQMQMLLRMGQNNDIQGLEQYAQQLFNSQGRDFSTEMNNLMSLIKKS